jgi:hypothetical protein
MNLAAFALRGTRVIPCHKAVSVAAETGRKGKKPTMFPWWVLIF